MANDALPNRIAADTLRISSNTADEPLAVEHVWVQHLYWMYQPSP
ncbi:MULTISPECIES: hypothetical protein [Streptomycetaceae]